MDSFPQQLESTATSLFLETGKKQSRVQLIASVMQSMEQYYEIFMQTGDFKNLKPIYEKRLVNYNRMVRVLSPNGEYIGTSRGINEKGELLFADKEYVDEQFSTLLGIGGHWNSQEKYYKSINIKMYGDAQNYGNFCLLLSIGCVFLINVPQAESSFKNCTYNKILNATESSYNITPSSCQVIKDGSQIRVKMVFNPNINHSVNVLPLVGGLKITDIYSATT